MTKTYGGRRTSVRPGPGSVSGVTSLEPFGQKNPSEPSIKLKQKSRNDLKLRSPFDLTGETDESLGRADDTFSSLLTGMNKLSVKDKKENIDPFDQLFEKVPNKTVKKKTSILAKEVFSSPEVSITTGGEEDSLTDGGLFSSFSKKKPVLSRVYTRKPAKTSKPKLKPKAPRPPVKPPERDRDALHDETCDARIVFAEDSPAPACAVSSLTNFLSPQFERSRLVSSTPVLGNSLAREPSARVESKLTKKSPADSVFLSQSPACRSGPPSGESNPAMESPAGSSDSPVFASVSQFKPSSLLEISPQSLDIIHSPPEASLDPTIPTPSPGSSKPPLVPSEDSYQEAEPSLTGEEEVEEEEEEEVFMNCICGDNSLDLLSVMCTYCGYGFHAACCGLDDEDLNDLETTGMTWACPRCLQELEAGKGGADLETPNTEEEEEEAIESRVSLGEQEPDNTQPGLAASLHEGDPSPGTDQLEADGEGDEASQHDGDLLPATTPLEAPLEAPLVEEFEKEVIEDPLSMTAQLEARHEEECGDEASFLFAKPLPAKVKTRARKMVEFDCTPGKKWRRSMAAEKWRRTQQSQTLQEKAPRMSFIVIPNTITEVEQPQITRPRDPRKSLFQLISNVSLLDEDALSPLSKLLNLCSLREVVSFEDIYDKKVLAKSSKLGEGAFGEVFGLGGGQDMPVLKVVPVGGKIQVNGFDQTTLEDISSEVLISSYLSGLRTREENSCAGFVELRRSHIFKGKYPERLLQLWDEFESKKGSENDRPDMLEEDQLYIALEYGNGGRDLEKFVFQHPGQAVQAWRQVAHSLAVAEQSLQFEHRDLHWGNVLVKKCREKTTNFMILGKSIAVETGGVKTQIIDFSLSRLQDQEGIVFKDLAQDPELFLGKGDYQFECYRMIRKNNQDKWDKFCPKSNIIWLHYLVKKMIDGASENKSEGVHYQKTSQKNKGKFSEGLNLLKSIEQNILEFDSATDYVLNDRIV